ncbi:MAG: hypothetical protein ACREFC_02165 [Stellaceae bacterium]
MLCDIEEHDLSRIVGDKRRDLERLLTEGYVQPAKASSGSRLQLTAKGLQFLGERGAGLNEA